MSTELQQNIHVKDEKKCTKACFLSFLFGDSLVYGMILRIADKMMKRPNTNLIANLLCISNFLDILSILIVAFFLKGLSIFTLFNLKMEISSFRFRNLVPVLAILYLFSRWWSTPFILESAHSSS